MPLPSYLLVETRLRNSFYIGTEALIFLELDSLVVVVDIPFRAFDCQWEGGCMYVEETVSASSSLSLVTSSKH